VHKNPDIHVPERHLGLKPGNEYDHVERKIEQIASYIAEQVDLNRLLEIASGSPILHTTDKPRKVSNNTDKTVRVAIARDAAFNFYYQDDLDAFVEQNAELVEFDTLHDSKLPENIDALFIGGGFPETQSEKLAANTELIRDIRSKIDNGLPAYAECGGLMYLSRSIAWDNSKFEMVGIIPADTVMHEKPQGRGYIRMEKTGAYPWTIESEDERFINAHEFHYSSLEDLEITDGFALKVLRGTGIDGEYDGIVYKNLLACYTHQRNTRSNPWVSRFIKFIRRHQKPV
jgi:cobyrinic acid a,c-diamide synthase